ncbi:hypothetical protein QF019_004560 [Pseudomonas frederiksbergensis]
MQNELVPHAQPSLFCKNDWGRAWFWPPYIAEQLFFEALIEPSLHRNNSPSQRSMPPFFPEHGVLPAQVSELITLSNRTNIGIQPQRINVRTVRPSQNHGPMISTFRANNRRTRKVPEPT